MKHLQTVLYVLELNHVRSDGILSFLKSVAKTVGIGLVLILIGLQLWSFYSVLFGQLPTDDVHYGYGEIFYLGLILPLVSFPLFIGSGVGAVYAKTVQGHHSKFLLFGVFIATLGISLGVAFFNFEDLYSQINLRP